MSIHITLANYFQSKPLYLDGEEFKKPNVRKLVEQPWQELEAAKAIEKSINKIQNANSKIQKEEETKREESWDNVTETLCNLDFIQAKAAAKLTYELVNEINKALEVIPDNAKEIAKEKARQARMEKYTQDLIACAEGKISRFDLEVPESITPWTEEQINAEIERIKTNPNRADKLKDFRNFLGQEIGNLQSYAYEFKHFAVQQAWNYTDDGPAGQASEAGSPENRNTMLLRSQPTRPSQNSNPLALQTLKGHNGSVTAVALSPDGSRAISGSQDLTCILWDLNTGQDLQILKGHTDSVYSVALSPDGKRAISGSRDNTCIIWDLESRQALQIIKGHTDSVTVVALSPDGKRAISGSRDNTCILWDLESGQALQTFKGHTASVTVVALSPDGKRAISGSRDNTCILWDLESGDELGIFIASSPISAIDIYPKGIFGGTNSGETFILQAGKELLMPDFGIVTARQIWDSEYMHYLPFSADCPFCGHRFSPPTLVLDTINEITKKAGLTPAQSPCLELPDEAWEHPGLLSECPKCKEKLKFNPFIAGGEEY